MLIKMLEIVIKLVSLLFILAGIILIYDARIVTKKFFSFGDQNEATQRIKNSRMDPCNHRRIHSIYHKLARGFLSTALRT